MWAVLLLLYVGQGWGQGFAAWEGLSIYQIRTDRFSCSHLPCGNCSDWNDYCGGTWRGIAVQLPAIQKMGFNGIWISPVIENTAGGYHGYWGKNFFKTNPNFGTDSDLLDLVHTAQELGIKVMVDVVANHVGYPKHSIAEISPFNETHYYHSQCQVSEYNCFTSNLQLCQLDGLPDLNQSVPFVAQQLHAYVNYLVETFDFDGLRIDTVPEVPVDFWPGFIGAANNIYAVGEVFSTSPACFDGYLPAVGALLSYPGFFTLRNCFSGSKNSLNDIQTLVSLYKTFPSNRMVPFNDNHDNPLFLSLEGASISGMRNILAFTLLGVGVTPIVYQGTEYGSANSNPRVPLWMVNGNFERTPILGDFITTLNRVRKQHKTEDFVQRYSTDDFYAWTVGDTFVAITNVNHTVSYQVTYLDYPIDSKLCNVFDPSDCMTVTSSGIQVVLSDEQPKIFVITLSANGSRNQKK